MSRFYRYIAAFAALTLLAGCAEGIIGGSDGPTSIITASPAPSSSVSSASSVSSVSSSAEASEASEASAEKEKQVIGESDVSVSQSSAALLPPKKAAAEKSTAEKQQGITVTFSSDSVPVGDLMMITVEGAKEKVTATTGLSKAPVFFQQGKKQVAVLPVAYTTAPGSYELTLQADNQTRRFTITVDDRAFDVQHLTVDPSTTQETVGSQKANQEWNEKIEPLKPVSDPEKYWSGAFLQPIQGRITTEYGSQRYTNGGSVPSRHGGVDLAAPTGTPVSATGAGRV